MTTATAMAGESRWRRCDTAIVGRNNYTGFAAVWPGIEADPDTDPYTRDLGHWLNTVEKVCFSRTLTEASWNNSRIATDVGATVRELRVLSGRRDILVLNSASIMQELLREDLLDELHLDVVPVIVGGGLRLLPDGLPASRWDLIGTTVMEHGVLALSWRRSR